MPDNIGERIASLEAEFRAFRSEMTKDNEYIRQKLDYIADSLTEKVDKSDCNPKHEKLNGGYEKIVERITELEKKTPVIVQQIVLVLSTGIVMAVVSYLISGLP